MAHADERRMLRTAKSCGPDAPTLAFKSVMMLRITLMTVARKPGHRGELEVSRKTIVQGMPGSLPVYLWRILVCFLPLHTRLWVQRAPGIPCALLLGDSVQAKLGRIGAAGM